MCTNTAEWCRPSIIEGLFHHSHGLNRRESCFWTRWGKNGGQKLNTRAPTRFPATLGDFRRRRVDLWRRRVAARAEADEDRIDWVLFAGFVRTWKRGACYKKMTGRAQIGWDTSGTVHVNSTLNQEDQKQTRAARKRASALIPCWKLKGFHQNKSLLISLMCLHTYNIKVS